MVQGRLQGEHDGTIIFNIEIVLNIGIGRCLFE